MKDSSVRLPQLTWLRGIAALLVLFSHINRANETSYGGELKQEFWFLNWLDLGSFGVALFFTLSGCTLYLSSSRDGFPTPISWYRFYVKRFCRIWPAFVLALFAYLLAGYMLHNAFAPFKDSWIASPLLSPYSFRDVSNYLLLIFNFTGPAGLFNNAFWSLPVEFQYYLVLPFIVVLIQRFGPLALFGMIIVGHVLYKVGFTSIDSTLVFRLFFTFCLGVYSGYLYKNNQICLPTWLTSAILLTAVAFVYLFDKGFFSSLPMPSEWIIYGTTAVVCVMAVVFSDFKIPQTIAHTLSFYGNISYSLYLLHNLAIAIAVAVYLECHNALGEYKLIYLTISALFISTILAWFSYKYIELPSIRYGVILSTKGKLLS